MESMYIFRVCHIVVAASIFFVWVVRYSNIVDEFQAYGIPNWVRDFVGILKLSFCGLLVTNNPTLILVASGAMIILMGAAVIAHITVRHAVSKMLPSVGLLMVLVAIFLNALQTAP